MNRAVIKVTGDAAHGPRMAVHRFTPFVLHERLQMFGVEPIETRLSSMVMAQPLLWEDMKDISTQQGVHSFGFAATNGASRFSLLMTASRALGKNQVALVCRVVYAGD